ncbi:MAG: hypothetical protein NUV98_04300 [Candidatus Roizmanbacteria bacterium]|nr:hypothetical protein [Candidatus Roizmanbacteria bacterium]
MTSFNTRIASLERETGISSDILRIYLSKRLGSSLIISHNIPVSEVFLSMTLKALRKMLQYPFSNQLRYTTPERKRTATLRKIYQQYAMFYKLHEEYFNTRSNEAQISRFLTFPLILDLGIPRDILRRTLYVILQKVAPWELEALYRINTLYRLSIVKDLQEISSKPLYSRGSLLFFYARPFGIGYRANFIGLENGKQTNLYDQACGSDLDIRWIHSHNTASPPLLQYVSKLNAVHAKEDISFIVEFASMSSRSSDDVMPAELIDHITNLYLDTGPRIDTAQLINSPILFSYDQIRREKLKKASTENKLCLTPEVRKMLETAFVRVLKQHGANDVATRKLNVQWSTMLMKSQMETDFSGCISVHDLQETFHHIFLSSGYRFSQRDEAKLFSSIIHKVSR